VFQIVQMRILSVIVWYYLAFFAISVAMLGMTAGAVWVYLKYAKLTMQELSALLADTSLLTAVAMPASVMVLFCLVTTPRPTATSIFSWSLLMTAMTVPYFFAGITVSLALTRGPFPVSLVYGVDLLGAALGCAASVGVLSLLDGPSATLFAGLLASMAAHAFTSGTTQPEQAKLKQRSRWRRPLSVTFLLAILIPLNMAIPFGIKPLRVKDHFETYHGRFEKWNSYSRVVAHSPVASEPYLWGPSPLRNKNLLVQQAFLNIDGCAGTHMYHFDGTKESIDFLKYDIVNLAYHLPGVAKSAVIGVGGGRDLLAAHLFGVKDVTGIDVNPIFIDLHTKHPFYAPYSNLSAIPGLRLQVDDARTWFAATKESFDLIQMSMIDTWAATGAGAFSLSENGLYTLQGWRAFIGRLTDHGVFTVSRWYSPDNINESSRMVVLAMAVMTDLRTPNPRQCIFVACADNIATLVLSKSPFTPAKLKLLREATERLGFKVLIAPDSEPDSAVFQQIVSAKDLAGINAVANKTSLDLSISTDNRPFFFNQLRFRDIPYFIEMRHRNNLAGGVIEGNLRASIGLVLIFLLASVAVVGTILLPVRIAAKSTPRPILIIGTIHFALIGSGFMLAEISFLQFFGVFLGHPIYAMTVCLFSLILSSGIGSLASGSFPLNTTGRAVLWGLIVGGYLIATQWGLAHLFEANTAQPLPVRILISLAVVMPVGFLMGFAFPTGMCLMEKVDAGPTPWFWGINGATGVLASVVAVMVSMAFGINVTMLMAGLCYLALIPTGRALLARSAQRIV